MRRFLLSTFLVILIGVLAVPASASAAAKPGVKPGNFFYFFDTAFEKINLFFTFNPEKKAQKALEYADERLAEAEAVAERKNTDAVKTAVANYESNIALAAEQFKQIKDKEKAEGLLASITDNTSKHQEILSDVLSKVPDEAKEAITKAIEASRKGQEEATKQITELKGEVEQLKKEIAELKSKEAQTKTNEELNNQKFQNISAPAKPQASPVSETTQTPKSITFPPTQTPTSVTQPIITPTPTPATPTLTPSETIPATPAEPATPSPGTGTPATPAVPATPAQPSPSTPQDTTPPTISNIQATNITETSAAITWTTNEPASSEVYYALSSPITATSTIKVIGADNVASHSVSLTGLSSGRTHYYVVVSKDTAGNTATSSEQSFATLTPSPPPSPSSDTLGPWLSSVSISPTSGSPGTVITFSVTAEDPSGIGNVIYDIQFPGTTYILRPNCNFFGATNSTCTFSQSIDYVMSPPKLGEYVITIRAGDRLDNVSTYYPDGTVSNSNQSTHNLIIPSILIQ